MGDKDGEAEAELKRLAGGYLPAVEKIAKELTAPYWWCEPGARGASKVQSGTMCFVHTGSALLGVSAAHIHLAAVAAVEQGRTQAYQIGGHTFDAERHLVDIDEALDLVTYGLSEIQVNAAGASIHYALKWPPEVTKHDAYIVGGWLWEFAKDHGAEVTHYFGHYSAKLAGSAPDELTVYIDRPNSRAWGQGVIPPTTNIGGMSGGPIYRLSETGLSQLTLVGCIRGIAFEAVTGRPLSMVGPEGRILRR